MGLSLQKVIPFKLKFVEFKKKYFRPTRAAFELKENETLTAGYVRKKKLTACDQQSILCILPG
jgi:hypothetical protein